MNEEYNQQNQTTIADMGALLDKLISQSNIPESIRGMYWGVFDANTILSNLSEKEIQWMMNEYELFELRVIRKLKGHEYNADVALEMTQIKKVYFAILHRAKDGFERKTQATQIYSQITTEGRADPVHSTGFLAQFKRLIGGK